MKLRALLAASLVTATLFQCGCVTKQSTRGFQTNPPVNNSAAANGFGQSEPAGGLQKFFSKLAPRQPELPVGTGSALPPEQDATSLQSPATVSPELLIVAGEMGLQQQRYQVAAEYFTRALRMDPENARARAGLNQAQSALGQSTNPRPGFSSGPAASANPVGAAGSSSLPNSFSLSDQSPDVLPEAAGESGIRLVSYTESDESSVAPEAISVDPLTERSSSNDASRLELTPAIEIHRSSSPQRIANPFFGAEKPDALPARTRRVVEGSTQKGK